ncbi:capsular biosynthesis protein [Phyllobacterium myrsinacearum]|uniref:Capsular polysaccharide export protein n=1 Tax=Phyllobacterium myrsinacearum TaxID=28101 RepID=A0A839EKG9_9HYPH|nr:capsular biosynthesis protein [Phyllobacterium myrsinacearum]MBA8879362.1 capsular polysaccharide export protein [Phyllobacterium myrsinacearum]
MQGPVGPFFRTLANTFEASGFDVLKINFNGGDWLFSHGPGTLNFCGSMDAWSDWLDAFIRSRRPEAIVLFGDSRPYHRQAIMVALRAGVPVSSFEEGYVRPNFITCEWDGNNALSPLRRPRPARHESPAADAVEPVRGNLFRAMTFFAIRYYLAKTAGAVFFRGNVHHRSRGILSESILWTRNFYRKIRHYPANNEMMLNLIENLENQYFVVALQVHDDQQLLRHGRGWTMEKLITESIRSFRRFASPEHHLVIKVHPMDRGHKSYRPFAMELARIAGCDDRVHIVDDGSIGLLIRHSLGLVTVNSTSGLLALNHGKPVLSLGEAIYNKRDLVWTRYGDDLDGTSGIDGFWLSPAPPKRDAVKAFNKRMHEESLVNGSFYLRNLIDATTKRVVQRIQGDLKVISVGVPSALSEHPVEVPTEKNGAAQQQDIFPSLSPDLPN